MTRFLLALIALSFYSCSFSQDNPGITSWIINTNGLTGRHYVEGNSTPIEDSYLANVAQVQYSEDFAYISCSGIPGYIVGPYLDGNPSLAGDQDWLFKIPLDPTPETGSLTNVGMGQIGVLINGVPIYNYADGQSYNNQNVWHQDAVFFERDGFDCAKGHPSPNFQGGLEDGRYHHHQNPTAFNLDEVVVSDICDLYVADGLYVMDETVHSPLLGFAFDGYPIYGSFGYDNTDGTGGIVRIESSYQYTDATDRDNGPSYDQYPQGAYSEDFEFVEGSGHLDLHNGRFAVTPEYPEGTYAYYATVDENLNSFYPYLIGPTYYGEVETANFGMNGTNVTINEDVTTYDPSTSINDLDMGQVKVNVFPNPASDVIAIQLGAMVKANLDVRMYDLSGSLVYEGVLNQGSSICHIDTRRLYNGAYVVHVGNNSDSVIKNVVIQK